MVGVDFVTKEFKVHGLVPDVISTPPENLLILEFGSLKVANLGNELSIADTARAPTAISWPSEENALYTLVFGDADVPSRTDGTGRSFLHWLVTNIPESDLHDGNTIKGYVGPGAPQNTGLHRYYFLVYKQNGRITENDASDGYHGPNKEKMFTFIDEKYGSDPALAARIKAGVCWSPERFAKKHGLGAPVAGNFFQTQWKETSA
uniref:Phosphatidylethanolamine-binding protein n=1 Tax=Plectus sambesii TaxID=2011161 RepID=A0A914W6P9_9BILA